jgi:hypothetical protein
MAPKIKPKARSRSPRQPETSTGPGQAETFLTSFEYYVRIDFSFPQAEEHSDRPRHTLTDTLLSKLPSFCEQFVSGQPKDEVRLTLYPSLFATCEQEAVASAECNQDRGSLLIGITTDDDNILADIDESFKDFEYTILETEQEFIDSAPETFWLSLSMNRVSVSELQPIIVDRWVYPEVSFPEQREWGTASKQGSMAIRMPVALAPESKLTDFKTVISALEHNAAWSQGFGTGAYVGVYIDRFIGWLEKDLSNLKSDVTDEGFVPQTRFYAIRRKRTGEVLWQRHLRIDKIKGSKR